MSQADGGDRRDHTSRPFGRNDAATTDAEPGRADPGSAQPAEPAEPAEPASAQSAQSAQSAEPAIAQPDDNGRASTVLHIPFSPSPAFGEEPPVDAEGRREERVVHLPERESETDPVVDVLGGTLGAAPHNPVEPGTATRTVRVTSTTSRLASELEAAARRERTTQLGLELPDDSGRGGATHGSRSHHSTSDDAALDGALAEAATPLEDLVINSTGSRGGPRGTTITIRADAPDVVPPVETAVEPAEVAVADPATDTTSVDPAHANPYLDEPPGDAVASANPFTPLVIDSSPGALAGSGVEPARSLRLATQPDQSALAARQQLVSQERQTVAARRPKVRWRSIVSAVVRLLIALGLIAGAAYAGYIYLWPMVAPSAWSDTAAPYAEALETVVGTDFDEAVDVVAESPAVFDARAGDTIFDDWEAQLPTWRALGLVDGPVDRNLLDQALSDWDPALYAGGELVVYHDQTIGGSLYDAHVTRQLALAYLDQRTGWYDAAQRSPLDERAVQVAQAYADATALQRATPFSTPIPAPDIRSLQPLPPVIAYTMMAPVVFAELHDRTGEEVAAALAAPDESQATSSAPESGAVSVPALTSLEAAPPSGTSAPGTTPVATHGIPEVTSAIDLTRALRPPLGASPAPMTAAGDTVTTAPSWDRAMWYLVLAAFLDAPTAWTSSQSVTASTVAVPITDGGCVFATLEGVDAITTAELHNVLKQWAGAAPEVLRAEVTMLADGTPQLRTCDPGVASLVGARRGTAFELVGWRTVEHATVAQAIAGERTLSSVTPALSAGRDAGLGTQLVAMAPSATVDELTAAAAAGLASLNL